MISDEYSSAYGSVIVGERMQVAMVHKEKGTGSRLHSHPNEQFNYVLKGEIRAKVEEEETMMRPGDLVHIPANAAHYLVAVSEGGADYFVVKDTSWGIAGAAVDGKKTGAHYETGLEPEKRVSSVRQEEPMKYFYNLDEKDDIAIGPDYSSAHGGWVKGERLQVLLYHKPKGTGSRPHRHSNEQFIYILQGSVIARIEDKEKIAGKGEVIHIPVNALHSMVATTQEDVVYYVAKDTTFGIHGIPEDGEKTGAHYEPGYAPEKKG
jgi:quercetin dioxygenase-like cupin family protein